MPVNLLAICRSGENLVIKRVKTNGDVQNALEGVFAAQEQDFYAGVDQDVLFDGGWKPEKNELLMAAATQGMVALLDAAKGNLTALHEIAAANFANEGIRALAVVSGAGDNLKLLIQNFSARQILGRNISMIWDGDTFTKLTAPAFTIGASLAGVLDAQYLRFKSFSNIKMVFDLANLYQEASDAEIDTFAQHATLQLDDVAGFKGIADQTMRKLVHAISAKGVLDTYDITAISAAALAQDFQLVVSGTKLQVPADRAGAKQLMHFLDEGLFRGPLSGNAYITNSKRKV